MNKELDLKQYRADLEAVAKLGLAENFQQYIGVIAEKYFHNRTEMLLSYAYDLELVRSFLATKPDNIALSNLYSILAGIAFLKVADTGFDIDSFKLRYFDTEQIIGEDTITPHAMLTIAQASKASALLKEEGAKVGLLHGHFRLLTPSSLVYLTLAQAQVDVLLLGVETAERTIKHKRKQPMLDDQTRAGLFRTLLPCPFFIDEEVEYSNDGYAKLVSDLQSDIYFGQRGNPKMLREGMRERAEHAGSAYVELPSVLGYSTSAFEQMLKSIQEGQELT